MIGNVKTPLPSLANGFARTPGESMCPALRAPANISRRGLVGSCNPCLGIQQNNLYNLGRQVRGQNNAATKAWVMSPVGPAVVLNEGSDLISWLAANNNDFQFQDAYGLYEITLSCVVRVHSSGETRGWLFVSDRVTNTFWQGEYIFIDEASKFVAAGYSDGSVGTGSASYYKTADNVISLDTWHHIVVTWSEGEDSAGTPVVYVDGKKYLASTFVGTSKPLTHSSSAATSIGRNQTSSKLDLADWAIWNCGFKMEALKPLLADPVCYLRRADAIRGRQGWKRPKRRVRIDDLLLDIT